MLQNIWCKELKRLRNLEPFIFNSSPNNGQIKNELVFDRYVPEDLLRNT
jgi:hypothetical protein